MSWHSMGAAYGTAGAVDATPLIRFLPVALHHVRRRALPVYAGTADRRAEPDPVRSVDDFQDLQPADLR
jgi:hypothetical protein